MMKKNKTRNNYGKHDYLNEEKQKIWCEFPCSQPKKEKYNKNELVKQT